MPDARALSGAMAVAESKVYAGYLRDAVAQTVEGFGGVLQHLQNLLNYRDAPSAIQFVDVELDTAGCMTIHADLHNAPSTEDMRKYVGSLGNKADMAVTPGSNEKGHGGKAGFHSDAKVGLLGAKAGERYTLGFPQTSGMVEYMKAHPLKLGPNTWDGETALNVLVFAKRVNELDKPVGIYKAFAPADEVTDEVRLRAPGVCRVPHCLADALCFAHCIGVL